MNKRIYNNEPFTIALFTIIGCILVIIALNVEMSVETKLELMFIAGGAFAPLVSSAAQFLTNITLKALTKKGEKIEKNLNDRAIKEIIENNNIEDLRTLLKFLGNPDINYQVFWAVVVVGEDDELLFDSMYNEDCEYFFESTFENGYKKLEEFEEHYYEVEIELWDGHYYYDCEKNLLYYYIFRDEAPTVCTFDEIEEDESYIDIKNILWFEKE